MSSQYIFYKFHGTGNDFILVDNRSGHLFSTSQIRHWCERRTGVGADGFILLEYDAGGADFGMRYYNADGLEASLCGNGSRCAVALAHRLGMIGGKCLFRAFDGLHRAEVVENSGSRWLISLEMKSPLEIECYEDGYFLDTGSPHFVRFVEDVEAVDLEMEGKKLRHDPRFPEGCNVNFVKGVQSAITMRTYERGVEGETLSCGTGATAAAMAFALHNNLPEGSHNLLVNTRGGFLRVRYVKEGGQFAEVFLEGPAVQVFQFEITEEIKSEKN